MTSNNSNNDNNCNIVSTEINEITTTKPQDSIVIRTQSGIETISLEGLTPEQKQELKMKYASMAIETQDRVNRLASDVNALGASLNVMAKNTKDVAESGQSITITNTKEDNLGRTEVIMGTSDAAKSGKLTRSARGLKDNTTLWLGVVVLVIAIIALVVVKTQ